MQVVFTNLMNNAKDAMPNGGQISLKSYHENEYVIVKFSDTGIGIPDDIKTKVWDPYSSGHRRTVGNSTAGRGWGLTIVHRIISEHGGTINFVSKENEGTVFTLKIPVTKT